MTDNIIPQDNHNDGVGCPCGFFLRFIRGISMLVWLFFLAMWIVVLVKQPTVHAISGDSVVDFGWLIFDGVGNASITLLFLMAELPLTSRPVVSTLFRLPGWASWPGRGFGMAWVASQWYRVVPSTVFQPTVAVPLALVVVDLLLTVWYWWNYQKGGEGLAVAALSLEDREDGIVPPQFVSGAELNIHVADPPPPPGKGNGGPFFGQPSLPVRGGFAPSGGGRTMDEEGYTLVHAALVLGMTVDELRRNLGHAGGLEVAKRMHQERQLLLDNVAHR